MKKNKPYIKLFIHFDRPPTKKRGRGSPVFKNGKFIKTQVFTPKDTKDNMKIIASATAKHVTDEDKTSVFRLCVIARFPRPANLMNKMEEDTIIIGKGGSYADWDNIGKIVSDALNHVVWKDDAQVGDGRSIRRYVKKVKGEWEQPGIFFTITKICKII